MPSIPQFKSAWDAMRKRLPGRPGPGLARIGRGLGMSVLLCIHGVVLLWLAGVLLFPVLAIRYLRMEASQAIGRDISLESLRFNPFTFDLKAAGLTITDKSERGILAGFSSLEVNLDPLALVEKRLKVSRFLLENPELHLARDSSGRLNIVDLMPKPASNQPSQPRTFELIPAGVSFSLSDVRIVGGSVSFDDSLTGTRQEVKDLRFTIESLSSDQPGLHEIFSTGGQVNESSLVLAVRADLMADVPELEARLSVKNVVFRHYTPYFLKLKRPLDLKMEEAGVWARATLPRRSGISALRVEGNAKLSGVSLGAPEEQVAGFETLEIQGASLDAASGAIRAERVEIVSPSLRVNRDEAGVFDLLALLEQVPAPTAEQGAPARPAVPSPGGPAPSDAGRHGPSLSVGEVVLKGGQARLNDQGLAMAVSLTNVQARLAGLDTGAGRLGSLTMEASGDRFKRLMIEAQGGFSPVNLAGKASVEEIDLSQPIPLLKRLLPKLGLSGTASCTVGFSMDATSGDSLPKLNAGLDLKAFKAQVEGQAEPLFAADSLGVSGVGANLGARRVTVGQVQVAGGGMAVSRDEKGGFPAMEALGVGQSGQGGRGGGAAPWAVSVDQVRLAGFSLRYSDAQAKLEERLDLEECGVKDFATDLEKPLTVEVKGSINGQAPFEAQGQIGLKQPSLGLKLSASGLPLADIARLAPALPASVLSGQASLSGDVAASLGANGPSATFKGDASIADLKLARPGQDEPWAGFAALSLKGADCSLAPLDFKAVSLTLDSPMLSLTLDKDGKPVLPFAIQTGAGPSGQGGQPAGAPGASPAAFSYALDQVEVKGGQVDLTAQGFDPPLTGRLADITASLAGVRPNQPTKIVLSLAVGHAGKLQAQGQAGWISGAPMLDLKATLENMDLGEISPVSQKFTGFPITRGKLGLKLDYKAEAKKLDLDNKILVVGIQLGRKTAQPGGKDIPLDLAVSLLTNSKGVIDLDIPVKGDLSKAKADLSDVVSTAMAGMFAKILFSPLAFLNVAHGSGRTAFVDFAPGSAELTPEARKTLAALGDALRDRPRLSLEVMAYADPKAEAASLSEAGKPPQAPQPPAEKPAQGKARPSQGAKPGQPVPPSGEHPGAGQAKPSPPDWASLAKQRQDAVIAFLTGPGKLPQERVFPITGQALQPPAVKGQSGSRADVRLRY